MKQNMPKNIGFFFVSLINNSNSPPYILFNSLNIFNSSMPSSKCLLSSRMMIFPIISLFLYNRNDDT